MQMDQVRMGHASAAQLQYVVACLMCQLLSEQILANTADMIKNFAVTYLVDITEVPDFNTMYEVRMLLRDPVLISLHCDTNVL